MILTEAIAHFTRAIEAQGKSPLTLDVYRRELGKLHAFMGDLDTAALSADVIHQYLLSDGARLQPGGRPRGAATLARTKTLLRRFGQHLADHGLAPNNPARTLKVQRSPRPEPRHLTHDEALRLTKAVHARKGAHAERDAVMLELFLHTGIRLAELVGLDLSDIDLDGKHLHLLKTKGGQPATRFLNTHLRRLLRSYLRQRRHAPQDCPALFLSNRNTRITTRQVQRRFALWLTWAGITKKLTVHSLRHSFATHLYGRTKNLLLVSKALGHRQLATAQVYTHLFDHELEDALERE